MKNELRIIAGSWRGRKLGFFPAEGLRPTPARVRETLFNWLRDDISGAVCLDLFAGSGALSMEALSRGASHVTQVESHHKVCAKLRENIRELAVNDCAEVINTRVEQFLRSNKSRQFDLVFMDPPFRQNMVEPVCQLLAERDWLSHEAIIYLETEQELSQLKLPSHWERLRSKVAGDVAYSLYQRKI